MISKSLIIILSEQTFIIVNMKHHKNKAVKILPVMICLFKNYNNKTFSIN
jgi:hypothetical protein